MAALDDLLSAVKNVVTAINGAAQYYAQVNGLQTKGAITAPILLKQGAGRVATVSTINGGTANGTIYDSTDVTSSANPIYTIINTPGVVHVNMPVSFGIVVKPGAGQTVAVSYS